MARHARRIATDLMDQPHVAGHRVSVRRIHALVEERELAPADVADSLELGLTDVYDALAYYHDHRDEMDEVERRREAVTQQVREQGAITGPDDC